MPKTKSAKPATNTAAATGTDLDRVANFALTKLREMTPEARRIFLDGLRHGELSATAKSLGIHPIGKKREALIALVATAVADIEKAEEVRVERTDEQQPAALATPDAALEAPTVAHVATEEPAAPIAADAPAAAPEGEQPAKYYTLDGELFDVEPILATKTIVNGIALSDEECTAIRAMQPGDAMALDGELAGSFTLRCEAGEPPAEDAKRYTIDGESVALEEFIAVNTAPDVEPLADEEIAKLRALQPGEELVLGGGAGGTTVVRCEPPAPPANRYTIEGDEIDIEQFITMNAAPRGALTPEMIAQLRALCPGQELAVRAGSIEYSIRCEQAEPAKEPAERERAQKERDPRLPPVGTVIQKKNRHGAVRCECTVEQDGIRYAGQLYKSLSAAGIAANKDLGLGGKTLNGYVFWGLEKREPPTTDGGAKRPAKQPKPVNVDDEIAALTKEWERYRARAERVANAAGGDAVRARVHATLNQHARATELLAARVA